MEPARGIPPSEVTDVEDVAWALQTAASLWAKNEHTDAIVWLRRAAQAAGDAEQDERALALARQAAELSEWLAQGPAVDIPVDLSSQAKLPVTSTLPPVSQPEVFTSVTHDSGNVRSAAEAHAGILDPWATSDETRAPPPPPPPHPGSNPHIPIAPKVTTTTTTVVSGDDYDEVVTSARLELPAPEPAVVMSLPQSGSAHDKPPKISFPVEQTLVSAGIVPSRVELSEAEALTDLPDDARAALERSATIHHLSKDEEVMGFALAYIVTGELDVAAQIVDVPAGRIVEGTVLKARGTVAEAVPIRLVCISDRAVVATWDAEQIEPAFKACPWVEDDLRAEANRVQALVGITLGPLAEKLDTQLRAQVTSKLKLRELAEGEVLVEAGEPVKDLCLIGQGRIELVKEGQVEGEVGVGEFLFPGEIMSAAKAKVTARVGKGGALVLAGARSVAQELMSTCPPLIEIFSA